MNKTMLKGFFKNNRLVNKVKSSLLISLSLILLIVSFNVILGFHVHAVNNKKDKYVSNRVVIKYKRGLSASQKQKEIAKVSNLIKQAGGVVEQSTVQGISKQNKDKSVHVDSANTSNARVVKEQEEQNVKVKNRPDSQKFQNADNLLAKLGDVQVVKFSNSAQAEIYAKKIAKLANVEYVEPVYIAYIDNVFSNFKQIKQAKVNVSNGWQTYTNTLWPGDYPSDFESANNPSSGRHWYLEKARFPEYWHLQGCASGDANCLADSSLVVAIIDTGLAVDGNASNPVTARFTYNNSCYDENEDGEYSADECLLPIAEEGDLDFELQFVMPPQIDTNVLWTNPNESDTPECNDVHGVDMEMVNYNNDNNIAHDCSIDNRAKEGIPADDYGHGTVVAEIIAATLGDSSSANQIGMVPNVKIMPIKVNVPFTGTLYLDRIASGIIYAVDNGAKVINISASTAYDSQLMRDAIQYALDHNVMIIASSGNEGQTTLAYPAKYTTEYTNVIAVGALEADDSRTTYSNYELGKTFYAYVGSYNDKTNGLQTLTLSCEMEELNCVAQKDENDNVYKKLYDQFNDTIHVGTSFASPQIASAVANMYLADPNIKVSTIRRLLRQEDPFPSMQDRTIQMYKYARLPYFDGSKPVLSNIDVQDFANIFADDYVKQKPYWHKLNINPRTFVIGKRDWSDGIQVVQVNPGQSGSSKIAWWYTYDSGSKVYTSLGASSARLSNMRTLISDFGNDKTDVFFMADLVGSLHNDYQDAGKDAVVVRFVENNGNTNLQVYVASHEVKELDSSTHEVSEKMGFYGKVLDTSLSYDVSQLSAYMQDLDNDGHEDLIIRIDESSGSGQNTSTNTTWLGFLATYSASGSLSFDDAITLASNIPADNRVFFVKDVTGDGKADLVYGQINSDTEVKWYVRENVNTFGGMAFGSESVWSNDFGNKQDVFYMADVTGDGKQDLIAKRFVNEDTIAWYVGVADSDSFENETQWISDFGNYGDRFFFTDLNADDKADIVVLRSTHEHVGGTNLNIYTRLSTGSSFGGTFAQHTMPDYSDIVLVNDFTGDGLSDIAIGRPLGYSTLQWSVSSASIENQQIVFNDIVSWSDDFGNPGDKVWSADLNADNKADLLLKRVKSDTIISWYVVLSETNSFGASQQWAYDFGNDSVNDKWYVADYNGDGKADLALARKVSNTQVRWYVELSKGDAFKPWTIWVEDFGNDFSYDHYFASDITGDGKADFVLARVDADDSDIVSWYVAKSDGTRIVNISKWVSDFGKQGDKWLLADFYDIDTVNGVQDTSDVMLVRKEVNSFNLYLSPSFGNSLGAWIDPGVGIDGSHFYLKFVPANLNIDDLPDIITIDDSIPYSVVRASVNRKTE